MILNVSTVSMLVVILSVLVWSRVGAMDSDTLELLTPSKAEGEYCGYESCPRMNPNELNIHIVPSTHYEIGRGATFEDHYTGRDNFFDTRLANVKRMFDHVIQELWNYENRKFTITDLGYFFYWWSKRDGTVHRMVYTMLRQGRLSLVGGPLAIPDEAVTSYHAIIEAFTYSLRKINSTFLDCGRPLVTWQIHALGHSREVASLMAQMGFDGHFISPISFDDHIARIQRQGMEFLWRGSDDIGVYSDIYTHVLFDDIQAPPGFCFSSGCDDPLIITSDTAVNNAEERAEEFVKSMLYRQAPHYNTSNLLVIMGARASYHDASMWFNSIDKLMLALGGLNTKKVKKNVNVVYSTPYCYLRAVHEAQPALETKQDDFFPIAGDANSYATGFYTTAPSVKLLAKEALHCLQIAKQLQVLAKLYNNDRKFEEMQWIFGVFQDHTVITGNMRDYVKKNYVKRLHEATQRTLLIMKQAFNKVRKSPTGTIYYRCMFNMSVCNVRDRFIVIYNPLAWPVTIPVRLPSYKNINRVYNHRGEEIKTSMMIIPEIITRMPGRNVSTGHELIFIAEDIPPLGYRSYFIEKGEPRRRARDTDKENRNTTKLRKKRSIPSHNEEKSTGVINENESNTVSNYTNLNNTEIKYSKPIYLKKVYGIKSERENSNKVHNRRIHNNKSYHSHMETQNKTNKNRQKQGHRPKIENKDNNNTVEILLKRYNKRNKNGKVNNSVDDEIKRSERASVPKTFDNKRSIIRIKKIKNKAKKFMILRQANQDMNEQPLINSMESDYEYFDEDLKKSEHPMTNNTNALPDDNTTIKPGVINDGDINNFIKNIHTMDISTIDTPVIKNDAQEDIIDTVSKTLMEANSPNETDLDYSYSFSNDTNDYDLDSSEKQKEETARVLNEIRKEVGINDFPVTTLEPEGELDNEQVNMNEKNDKNGTTKLEIADKSVKEDPAKLLNETRKAASINFDKKVVEKDENSETNLTKKKVSSTTPKTKDLLETKDLHESSETSKNNNKTVHLKTTTERNRKQTTKNRAGVDVDNKKPNTQYVPKKVIPEKKIDGRKKFQYDSKDEIKGLYKISTDNFIENKYIKLTLDPRHRKINGMYLSNGVNISLDMQFYYYVSDDPDRTYNHKVKNPNPEEKRLQELRKIKAKPPGVLLFRSIDNKPVPIMDYLNVKVLKTDIVQEVQYQYADHAGLTVRLYADSPIVETDWVVAPIPFTSATPDFMGTEIFIRYMTDLATDGVFYTDSNGRQMVKRIRNMRPTYDHVNRDPVAGNFYPVTSKVSIVDTARNIRLSVLTDRGQGGASLADGEVDLMLQRRICTDQDRVTIFANETEFGQPVWVRGRHLLYLSKDDYRPNRIFEKKLAKELHLPPIVLNSDSYPYGAKSKEKWFRHTNEYSYLKTRLPLGVHLLTLQEWNDNTLLIRFENYLEKSDVIKTGVKTVFMKDLFKNLRIKNVKETTLGGNIWLKDFLPLLWKKKDRFVKNFNDFYATGMPIEWADDDYFEEIDQRHWKAGIVLKPQQIRTFVCEFEYV